MKMSKLIERPEYLQQLIDFRDKQLIKVVSGIRRCGKSTLFDLYADYLRENGVKDNQIIRLNLEDPDYEMKTYKELYDYIKKQLLENEMNYIFIDEVQTVPEFQKAVDGLFIRKNCDVYITGSNAMLLSGELATLLTGRYVEIKMLPLSFKEYISALGEQTDLIIKYNKYLENSSFPYTLELSKQKDIRAYLGGIFDSIILKDIVSRKKIADVEQLQDVTKFMFDNIGNITSSTKITETMMANGRKISVNTVENYLNALTQSFVLYKANRYNIKGKKLLASGNKYYLADIGLRYYLLGSKRADTGHILENIVYLELLRRGYEVYVGQVDNGEVDFYAVNAEGEEYYQVAYTLATAEILTRELGSLNKIKDHNPKYLITMDFAPPISHNGIKQINALEWLLGH